MVKQQQELFTDKPVSKYANRKLLTKELVEMFNHRFVHGEVVDGWAVIAAHLEGALEILEPDDAARIRDDYKAWAVCTAKAYLMFSIGKAILRHR